MYRTAKNSFLSTFHTKMKIKFLKFWIRKNLPTWNILHDSKRNRRYTISLKKIRERKWKIRVLKNLCIFTLYSVYTKISPFKSRSSFTILDSIDDLRNVEPISLLKTSLNPKNREVHKHKSGKSITFQIIFTTENRTDKWNSKLRIESFLTWIEVYLTCNFNWTGLFLIYEILSGIWGWNRQGLSEFSCSRRLAKGVPRNLCPRKLRHQIPWFRFQV